MRSGTKKQERMANAEICNKHLAEITYHSEQLATITNNMYFSKARKVDIHNVSKAKRRLHLAMNALGIEWRKL